MNTPDILRRHTIERPALVRLSSIFAALSPLALATVMGCSSAPPSEPVGNTAAAISTSDIVSRAMEWVDADLHYCQAAHGAVDGDSSCWAWEGSSHVCDRESNAAWNAYRSDCSGFVTWAWGLSPVGDGGYVTSNFAPFSNTFSHTIDGSQLQPGDALNLTSDEHIVLFKQWVVVGQSAVFMEEPGCSSSPPYAHEFTSNVSISGDEVYIDYEGATFYAIRYAGVSGTSSSGGPVVGLDGKCLDVLGDVSTNGTRIDLYGCNGGENQMWTLENGQLESLGKCLDVVNGGTTDGTAVQLWECNGNPQQKWTYQANGTLLNPNSKKCLNVPGFASSNGTKLIIWDCETSGNSNEIWKIGSGPGPTSVSDSCSNGSGFCTETLQCDSGHWIARADDSASCTSVENVSEPCSGGDGYCTATLQCDGGYWVPRTSDSAACTSGPGG